MTKQGVESPYKDDTNRYVWDWSKDCYRVAETGVICPTCECPRKTAKKLIDAKTYRRTHDAPEMFEDIHEYPDVEFYMVFTLDMRPIALTAQSPALGRCVYSHFKWRDVDWQINSWGSDPTGAVRFEVKYDEGMDLWRATAYDKDEGDLGTGTAGSAMGAIETWAMLFEEREGYK